MIPPPVHGKFRQQNFFETQKGPSTKLSVLWNKKIRRRVVIALPSWARKLWIPESFWNTERFHQEDFGTEMKNFRQKIETYASFAWNWSIPGIRETLKGYLTKFFGTERKSIFDGKSWYFPVPFYAWKFLIPEKFWQKLKGSPKRFRYWDETFLTESRDICLFCIELFDTRK